jgi:pyridoxine kinase
MCRVKILSIQSSVAYGHVGNSAAVFPLQRLGHEVWPVLTVHFSNHTGYGAWRGPLLAPTDVADVINGIDDRGVLGEADAVLSGYQGDPAVGAVILDTVARVKGLNPDAVYCCDPVMGDVGRGMFVRPGIPEFMRDTVVPQADILTPNHFELDFWPTAPRPRSTRCSRPWTWSASGGPATYSSRASCTTGWPRTRWTSWRSPTRARGR